jgi:hypothetical protein
MQLFYEQSAASPPLQSHNLLIISHQPKSEAGDLNLGRLCASPTVVDNLSSLQSNRRVAGSWKLRLGVANDVQSPRALS